MREKTLEGNVSQPGPLHMYVYYYFFNLKFQNVLERMCLLFIFSKTCIDGGQLKSTEPSTEFSGTKKPHNLRHHRRCGQACLSARSIVVKALIIPQSCCRCLSLLVQVWYAGNGTDLNELPLGKAGVQGE